MRKLKAFTIIELLVAMVIGALVTTFAYYGYDIVWKYFQNYRKTDKIISQLVQLRVAVEADFMHAQSINTGNSSLLFTMPDGAQVNYMFNNGTVIRNLHTAIDSFNVNLSYYELRYNAEKRPLVGSLIDELYLEAKIVGEQEKCYFFKNYSSEELILNEKVE